MISADEYIQAPRQTSKLRFALLVGLVVVLLVIFIVPGAILGIAGDGDNDPIILLWQRPESGEVQYRYREFKLEQQAFDFAFEIDWVLKGQLEILGRRPTEEQIARLLVLEQLALDAGVRITQDDLREHLQMLITFSFQGSAELYKQFANRFGSVELVENTIRRALRAERFLQLAGFAGALPDPDEIESLWEQDHVEVAFDYITLDFAGFDSPTQ